MSVIARRTVSIFPASTSERRVSRSRRPIACVVSNSCSSLAAGQLGLGLLYRGELFLRRLGYEVVAAVEAEIGEEERVDAEGDERRPDVHDKGRNDRENRQHERHARGGHAARRAIGTIQVRFALAQHYVREHHQRIRDRGAEDGAVDQRDTAGAADRDRKDQADGAGDYQGHPRRPPTSSYREEPREVSGSGERESLARVGEDEREEAR